MKPHLVRLRSWSIALAFVIGPATASLFAQNTGTVQGRVCNSTLQQYVGNAEVRLEGTTQVASTEHDGSWQFNPVPGGPAALSIVFAGYEPVRDTPRPP